MHLRIMNYKILKWIAFPILIIGVLVIFLPLPDPLFNETYSTLLTSRDGSLLNATIAQDQQWRFPPEENSPEKFSIAIRYYEDEYFYWHPGVNPLSLARAFIQNMKAGRIVSGGSTITMQTVRMAYGNKPRTYSQKLKEILAAFKLELLYPKRKILGLYSNHAPFGGNTVGISAASWRYYGRPANQLSWAEAAALAVLPNHPADIFPGRNKHLFKEKRDRLLEKLSKHGYLNPEQLEISKLEDLPGTPHPLPSLAYHLLQRAIKEGHHGKTIKTTLSLTLQKRASKLVNTYSSKLASDQIFNAAAIIIDVSTGQTLAYVGNSDNPGNHGQHVDIITSNRSPGSLLKPFLYTMALDEGLILPDQLLPDVPVFYRGFSPKNFDKRFRGVVPANEALTSSLNVPFVQLLIRYGYENFHNHLKHIGLHSLDKPAGHYGLSLILGGGETSLWELTSAYAGMVRAYLRYPNRPYQLGYSTSDYHENRYLINDTLLQRSPLEKQGYLKAPSIGFTLRNLQRLTRPDQEAGWKEFSNSLKMAWKTGTSYGLRDGWAIGMTNQHVIGVWVGNADGEGRPGLTGLRAASPLLFDLAGLLNDDVTFDEPYGQNVAICDISGMRAGPYCDKTVKIALPGYLMNTRLCTYHKQIHVNKSVTVQVNSNCYDLSQSKTVSWFVLPPAMSWYYKKFHPEYADLPPYDISCRSDNISNNIQMIYPDHYAKVFIPIEQDGVPGQVIFKANTQSQGEELFWHLDGFFIGTTTDIHQMGIRAKKGIHTLTIVDHHGNELKQPFEVVNQ